MIPGIGSGWPAATVDQGGFNDPEVFRISPRPPRGARRLDIVLVHGLGGHYLYTWRHGDSFWPIWLDEHIPEARVLSVRYPSSILPSDGSPLFENLAHGVRLALVNADVGSVATVFVCHSLGGLVVKRALEIDADEGGHEIWESTTGIAFFGTPHGGARIANFGRLIGSRLVSHLQDRKGEGLLDEMQRRFDAKISNRSADSPIRVFNFYETKPFGRTQIVDAETARRGYSHVESHPVGANHIWMVKFRRPNNAIYLKLIGQIRNWSSESSVSLVANDEVIDFVDDGIAMDLGWLERFAAKLAYFVAGFALVVTALWIWGLLLGEPG